jgi:hypothetical protein
VSWQNYPRRWAKSGLSRNFRAGLITQMDPKHGMPEMFYC